MLTDRVQKINKLQKVRNSKVLVYFMSDRRSPINIPGINTAIAGEPQLIIYDHLRKLGQVEQLDLVLHTRGGNVDAVWPLVNLCRAFTKIFCVLVPLRAHSAGTLICLGADEIVLGTASELSPIDPTTTNPFNPVDNKGNPKPISVEDVTSYFRLAKAEDKGVSLTKEENIVEIFKLLATQVSPLALGNVTRAHSQIRMIAEKLLALHLDVKTDKAMIESAIKLLVEELYSHTHVIGREEALSYLGEKLVHIPSKQEEEALWEVFESYADLFQLRTTFNVKEWMGSESEKEIDAIGAAIESEYMSHLFRFNSIVRMQPDLPPQFQVQIPAGQPMPQIPGLPKKISIEPQREGWYYNEEGM